MGSPLQTPSTWEVRLSELLSLSVPVQWPEAVAVVRRVALQAGGTGPVKVADAGAGATSQDDDDEDASTALVWPPRAADLAALEYLDTIHGVPDPSGIWLQADGTIRLEAAVGTPGQVVSRLGILLKALLPVASAPEDLLQLAESTSSATHTETNAKKFLDALTYFARPDDSQEIRALVARVLEARLAEERTRSLQVLTEKARHATPTAESANEGPRKPVPVRRLLVVGGCVAGVLTLTAALWIFVGSSPASPVDPQAEEAKPPTAARLVQNKLAAAAALMTETLTGRPEQPKVGRGADVQLPAPRRGRADRPAPSAADVLSSAPGATTESATPFEWRGADGSPQQRDLPASAGVPDALAAPVLGVYSSAHPDVVPPTLIRAQMPQLPLGGVPIIGQGALEILVGDDGQVVSARLVPNSHRYQDRMMVSAAKTWQFAPARRYGQPVRYRLQMPITW